MAAATPKLPGGEGSELAGKRDTPAAAESYSSQSEAYTSDAGGEGGGDEEDQGACGGGGGDATSEGGLGSSPASAGGASAAQGRKAAGRKGGGRGGRGGARGVSNGKPPARTAPPVLLLLAGLPGSGKSTFSRELLRMSPVAWIHVNQDAIRDGKPGNREQCLAAARAALEEGACCVVDRCHADAAQRDVLRSVAAERGVAAHCVALQTPLELCAKRVAARTDHPGGVQGDSSKRVVYTMASQMKKGNSWPPAASEGFASVMDCHNDADATAAVRAWAVYGSDGAGAQAAGAGAPPAKAADAARAEAGGRDGLAAAAAAAAAPPVTHGSAGARQDVPPGSASAAAADAATATLAIWRDHVSKRKPASSGIMSFFKPSATATKKESPVGAAAAKVSGSGLSAPKGGGAGAPGPQGASAVGGVATAAPADPARASRSGEAAGKAAATAAGVRTAAQDKASPRVTRRPRAEPAADERSAKRQAVAAPKEDVRGGGSGGGGNAATGVSASPASGIAAASGKAESALDACGDSPSQGRGEASGQGSGSQRGRNAFSVLMASASRKAADGPRGSASASGGGDGDAGSRHPVGAHKGDEPDARFKLGAPWAQALRNTALYPEQAQQEVLYKDDQVIMIGDVYPKAKHHALVVARDPALRSIADLRQEHLPLLAHMQKVACKWVEEARSKDPAAVAFKLGFHAVPSMCQVHMHVVSQDFDSPALKNKKHWNSFTTKFFLPLDIVMHELESRGRLMLIDQNEQHQLEGQELRCHGCAQPLKTMPELKKHIVACDAVKRLQGL